MKQMTAAERERERFKRLTTAQLKAKLTQPQVNDVGRRWARAELQKRGAARPKRRTPQNPFNFRW